MKRTTIKKWGNGAGILLPKAILEMLSLKTNDDVNMEVINHTIVISPIIKQHVTLEERFSTFYGTTKQEEFSESESIGKEVI